MSLQQIAFLVPPELDLGLATGELIRYGGVVRNQAGEIVAHLEEVDISLGDAVGEAVSKAIAVARENKGKVIIVGAAAAAVTGTVAFISYKRKAKKQVRQIELAEQFQEAMDSYFQAISNGALSKEIVDETISVIDDVNSNLRGKKNEVSLSQSILNSLVSSIEKYTRQLCEANDYKFKKVKQPLKKTQKSSLETLRSYLELQQDLLQKAA